MNAVAKIDPVAAKAGLFGAIRDTLNRIKDKDVRHAWRDFFANKIRERETGQYGIELRRPVRDDELLWLALKCGHMAPDLKRACLIAEIDGMRFMVTPMLETCVILGGNGERGGSQNG